MNFDQHLTLKEGNIFVRSRIKLVRGVADLVKSSFHNYRSARQAKTTIHVHIRVNTIRVVLV